VQAPKDAPNVVLIMLDDVGFGQAGTFGGSVPTPEMDLLADDGLLYNRFHTTGMSTPTRAALLTGRNSHQSGMGTITELSTGYPGYDSLWPRETASVARILKDNGYSTAAFGKWHNTPEWETSSIGPFERWPTGLGFEYFYGFFGGETSQWEPQLIRGTTPVEAPKRPDQGYHLNIDLVDDAISWMSLQRAVSPNKPYFMYLAPGAAHAPLHVDKEWIDRFKGQFDQGWDKVREETLARQKALGIVPQNTALTPRPEGLQAWASLSADEKRLFARHQEVFSGFLAQTDHEIGRLIRSIKQSPDADNTLIIYVIGDNGPSAEGGLNGTLNNKMNQYGFPDSVQEQLKHIDEIGSPKHSGQYPAGWAWAGSSPFQWMKRVPSHLGATRNGMIVSWPAKIKAKHEIRDQFHHVVDVTPTILQAANIPQPNQVDGAKQIPMAGVSMAYTFNDAHAKEQRKTQYFEVGGHRALYHDGWMASAFQGAPWVLTGSRGFKDSKWQLYNIKEDFSQSRDLAQQEPKRLKKMINMFDQEARANDIYPLDDRAVERAFNPERPSFIRGRKHFSYAAGATRIPAGSAPPTYKQSHSINAEIEVPNGMTNGVIVANGGAMGGYSLYLEDGVPVYEYNFFTKDYSRVKAKDALKPGKHTLNIRYDHPKNPSKYAQGGAVTLTVDGQEAGKGQLDRIVPYVFSFTETFDIGMDLGSVVSPKYSAKAPFAFEGKIKNVVVNID
ncbi:MAG: sulfatase-like hydrolase/transferase, partial [Acinetobacter sp.]